MPLLLPLAILIACCTAQQTPAGRIPAFVINLHERSDRWEAFLRGWAGVTSVAPIRFNASRHGEVAWQLPGREQPVILHNGCTASHLRALLEGAAVQAAPLHAQAAAFGVSPAELGLDTSYPFVLVLEDDARPAPYFDEAFIRLAGALAAAEEASAGAGWGHAVNLGGVTPGTIETLADGFPSLSYALGDAGGPLSSLLIQSQTSLSTVGMLYHPRLVALVDELAEAAGGQPLGTLPAAIDVMLTLPPMLNKFLVASPLVYQSAHGTSDVQAPSSGEDGGQQAHTPEVSNAESLPDFFDAAFQLAGLQALLQARAGEPGSGSGGRPILTCPAIEGGALPGSAPVYACPYAGSSNTDEKKAQRILSIGGCCSRFYSSARGLAAAGLAEGGDSAPLLLKGGQPWTHPVIRSLLLRKRLERSISPSIFLWHVYDGATATASSSSPLSAPLPDPWRYVLHALTTELGWQLHADSSPLAHLTNAHTNDPAIVVSPPAFPPLDATPTLGLLVVRSDGELPLFPTDALPYLSSVIQGLHCPDFVVSAQWSTSLGAHAALLPASNTGNTAGLPLQVAILPGAAGTPCAASRTYRLIWLRDDNAPPMPSGWAYAAL